MLEHMERKRYKKAMEIADTIDWRRVKNPAMLNSVSEIYEFNGEYQKSRDVLFVAYDRAPNSRKTIYRLGTLALRLNDVDEDGFTTNGVKLSMFDISDSSDVKEIQKYTLENVYSAAVMYDYKAVLIDPEKNVIGFAADGNNSENYYVFSYNDTNGFECLMNETVNGNGYQSARGVYVDNTLYVVKGNIIEAYDMADYQKIDDLIL